MIFKRLARPAVGVAIGIAAAFASFELLERVFFFVDTWYFHKYIEKFDPDPPFLPLFWVPISVFPPLAAGIGGAIAVWIVRVRSPFYPLGVGIAMGLAFLVINGAMPTSAIWWIAGMISLTGSVAGYVILWLTRKPART